MSVPRAARAALVGLAVLVAWTLVWPVLSSDAATTIDVNARLSGPSAAHWLGTDALGRDVLARLAEGARTSILFASLTASIAFFIGVSAGLWAGYSGGLLDRSVQRLADTIASLPRIPVLMFAAAVDLDRFIPAPPPAGDLAKLALVLVPFAWIGPFRFARTTARQARETELVRAAQVIGCSPTRVLTHHLLPLAAPTLVLAFTHAVVDLIVYESTLSYLGFGVPPPYPSLGTMLSAHLSDLERAPMLVLAPGALTLAFVAILFVIGDAFAGQANAKTEDDDLLDSRADGERRGGRGPVG